MSGTLIYSKELDFSKLAYWEISQYFNAEFLIVQIRDYNGGYSASIGKLWPILFVPGFGDTRYNYQEIAEGYNLIQSPGLTEQWKIAIQPFSKVVKLRIQIYEVPGMGLISRGSSATNTIASDANVTAVDAAVASTTLLVANPNRKKSIVMNESSAILYLAYGETASAAEHTIALQAGEGYESENFTGIVSGAWTSATGKAMVTEFE